MYLDNYSLIVQSDLDGGDCAARSGQYYFAKPSDRGFISVIVHLEKENGIWVRHPNYPDTKDFSRDQMDPLIMAMGENESGGALQDTFKEHAKRGFLYQNGDLPMLATFGLYIRAMKAWYLYPLLLITDIGLFFTFLTTMLDTNLNSVDDNNAVMRFAQAIKTYPTPLSYIGRKLYSATRPLNYGNTKLNEKNHVMGALMWYHRSGSNGNPEIAEAYRDIIEKYF